MRTRIIKTLAATVIWLLFVAAGRELVLFASVRFGAVPENFVGLLIVALIGLGVALLLWLTRGDDVRQRDLTTG
jgi:hypothetical protein